MKQSVLRSEIDYKLEYEMVKIENRALIDENKRLKAEYHLYEKN